MNRVAATLRLEKCSYTLVAEARSVITSLIALFPRLKASGVAKAKRREAARALSAMRT